MSTRPSFAARLAIGTLMLGASGCFGDEQPDTGGIAVGLLLPFTGSTSATASNLERATLYAADRINAAGGINGKKVRVVSRDTHSDVQRGVAEGEALADEGVVAIIGPESPEIAGGIRADLAQDKVLFLSPLVGAADEPGNDCDTPWFRLAGSAKALGEALAKQARSQNVQKVTVLYSATPYDRALGGAAASRFARLGGEVALELELDPNAQSYATEVRQAIRAGATDVILAASPRAGAIVVNEFDALSSAKPRWFLSPLLKTDLLVQNVAPQALEGALGVAPKIYETGQDFPKAFAERWLGDEPLEGAYFYYDAVALLAMSLAKSTLAGGSEPDLSSAVLNTADPRGERVSWDEIEVGIKPPRNGGDMYYSGLTGPISLDACGARAAGVTSSWTVQHGAIVDAPQ